MNDYKSRNNESNGSSASGILVVLFLFAIALGIIAIISLISSSPNNGKTDVITIEAPDWATIEAEEVEFEAQILLLSEFEVDLGSWEEGKLTFYENTLIAEMHDVVIYQLDSHEEVQTPIVVKGEYLFEITGEKPTISLSSTSEYRVSFLLEKIRTPK